MRTYLSSLLSMLFSFSQQFKQLHHYLIKSTAWPFTPLHAMCSFFSLDDVFLGSEQPNQIKILRIKEGLLSLQVNPRNFSKSIWQSEIISGHNDRPELDWLAGVMNSQ